MPDRQRTVIDLSLYPCPACGATNRWEGVRIEKLEDQPPTLTAWCDCALGELVVVIEVLRTRVFRDGCTVEVRGDA